MLSMTTKFDFLNSFDATVVQSFDDHIVKGGKFAPQRRRYSSIHTPAGPDAGHPGSQLGRRGRVFLLVACYGKNPHPG